MAVPPGGMLPNTCRSRFVAEPEFVTLPMFEIGLAFKETPAGSVSATEKGLEVATVPLLVITRVYLNASPGESMAGEAVFVTVRIGLPIVGGKLSVPWPGEPLFPGVTTAMLAVREPGAAVGETVTGMETVVTEFGGIEPFTLRFRLFAVPKFEMVPSGEVGVPARVVFGGRLSVMENGLAVGVFPILVIVKR